MAFNPKSLPAKVYEAYKLGVGLWPLVIERAIEAKITNTNKVADIMFYLHHPELKGRSIRSDETGLISEWKGFREMIRRRVEDAAQVTSIPPGFSCGFTIEFNGEHRRITDVHCEVDLNP